MRKLYLAFFLPVFILAFLFYALHAASALSQECSGTVSPDRLDTCIAEIEREIAALKPAHERNKQELAQLREQLRVIRGQIANISNQVNILEQSIFKREEDLALQEALLTQRIRSFYIRSRVYSPILVFLSSSSATELTRELALRGQAAAEDRRIIEDLAVQIFELRADKETLEKSKAGLERIQAQVDAQAEFLAGEVQKVESYLATLTAKQQSFIAQKLASLNLPTSLGAGPLFCVDDRDGKYDPGFRPAFAFFTYGIPHRVGMNQYGAFGRANAGQSHEDILRAYFDNFSFEQKDNINITVDGYGSMPLETYLLGIHEVPESWPLEAQKAQAIAARSYALSFTDNGAKSICTTQRCQVYKQPHKSGAWKTAVEQTAGKTMVSGGQPITAWYASTAGGYTFRSSDVGWGERSWTKRLRDTSSGVGGFGDLQGSAYDRDSPCFYAAQGGRSEYSKSAWLKAEEVVDIANVILLARADSSTREHLYQTDKPNPNGVDTWDAGRVKQELQSRGITPFTSVSSVSVSADFGLGRTNTVTVSGNRSESFSGDEFKDWFNLRAPANIQIVGPLFNVERK